MSFSCKKKVIEEGDRVILFLGFNSIVSEVVTARKKLQTTRGALNCRDLIGLPYGSKVQCKLGYLHVLQPTPELWTLTLPHRTQILYTPDISLILLQLDVKPGSVVIESGTGSGSMSHAIMRAVAPTGKLMTFEFHQERADKARQEFAEHGLSEVVEVRHADACEEGFGVRGVADAVFLDLPKPWLAIGHAVTALKRDGGRLCSFSPCIEQVQRTCEQLQKLGFVDIDTVECLSRNFEIRKAMTVPLPDLGHCEDSVTSESDGKPLSSRMDASKADGNEVTSTLSGSTGEPASKRPREELATKTKEAVGKSKNIPNFPHVQLMCALPPQITPGHTAFLTFGSLPPGLGGGAGQLLKAEGVEGKGEVTL